MVVKALFAGAVAPVLLFPFAGMPALSQPSVSPIPESEAVRATIDATGFTGTVLIYDQSEDRYVAGHSDRVHRQLMPASTFKILNALIALETGVVEDSGSMIEWDGVARDRSELNSDLDLTTAFRISALPHFQELARRIGAERMKHYVDAVGYGNRDISGGIDRFWLGGGLRISPDEQVEFVRRLYNDDLPFSLTSMAIVKGMMVIESTPIYTIRAKTGWGLPPDGGNVGWWVGWVERGEDVYFFATVLESQEAGSRFGPARINVTRSVLDSLGAFGRGE